MANVDGALRFLPITFAFSSALALSACGVLIGVGERWPAMNSGPTTPQSFGNEAGDGGESDGEANEAGHDASDAGRLSESLGIFEAPQLAFHDQDVLVADVAGGFSTIVVMTGGDPASAKTIYREPANDRALHVRRMTYGRDAIWYSTYDGALHTMTIDGGNRTLVPGPAMAIVAGTEQSVWTSSPDDLSNAPTLKWLNAIYPAGIPEASLSLGGPVLFASASDDELVYGSRTPQHQWTIERWRPLATEPRVVLTTFDAYPSAFAADAQRLIVYHHNEGTVVAWSRLSKETAPTTLLVDVREPIAIESDGTQLVMRSQSSLATCLIADCAATKRPLPVRTPFNHARYLHIDSDWAYFTHSKSGDGPWILTRVPR